MAKRHQRLIEYELLLKEFMVLMTNQAWARGYKMSYSFTWEKGKEKISDQLGGTTSNYYICKVWVKDKREVPTGVMIMLYNNYYPITVKLNTAEKAEEQAYKDLLLNGVQSLINVTFSLYLERQKQEIVRAEEQKVDDKIMALQESAISKPQLFVPENNIVQTNGNKTNVSEVIDILKNTIKKPEIII